MRSSTGAAILTGAVVVLAAAWVGWSWLSTSQQMDSLRDHPAFSIQAGSGARPVSVYERRPSLVEAVPLVRVTYQSSATPDDLATAVAAAYRRLAVQAEPYAFGIGARHEADRWRYSHWPHGRCRGTAVTVRITDREPDRQADDTVDDHGASPTTRPHSWLQVTARGCTPR